MSGKTYTPAHHKRALELYLQRYPHEEITKRTGIHKSALERWITAGDWANAREDLATSLRKLVESRGEEIASLLATSLRVHAKLLLRIEEKLDAGEDLRADELERLATAFNRTCDFLLRLLGQ